MTIYVPPGTARTVQAGSTRPFRLSLSGAAPLGADEALTVDFAYAPQGGGVSVSSPAQVRFTAGSTIAELTLSAATNALEGTLTATVSDALPSTLLIAPADLPVEILPREYVLAFLNLSEESRFPDVPIPDGTGEQSVRDVIAFPVDGAITSLSVSVSITHMYRNDLRVVLISPSGREVVLHSRSGGDAENLRRSWNDRNLPALADLLGTNPLGDWTLTVGDYERVDRGTLDEWSLRMMRYFSLRAGGTAPVQLSLSGEVPLGADEALTVDFAYASQSDGEGDGEGGGVSVSSPEQVRFTAGSVVADLTLSATREAISSTLTAVVSSTLPNTLPIAPTDLSVMVVREFTLTFATPEDEALTRVRVPANGTTRVSLSLSGVAPLGMDETLTVTFSYNPVDGGVSVSSPTQVSFVEGSTTIDLTLNAVAAARSGTLMASIEDAVNAIITPVSLSVFIPGADVRLQVRVLLEEALQ